MSKIQIVITDILLITAPGGCSLWTILAKVNPMLQFVALSITIVGGVLGVIKLIRDLKKK